MQNKSKIYDTNIKQILEGCVVLIIMIANNCFVFIPFSIDFSYWKQAALLAHTNAFCCSFNKQATTGN